MPSPTWDLALAELVYYIPASVPVVYCFWKHRKVGISGWLFLTAFVLLQIVGSGLTLSAGEHGRPSTTAITITSVGLSPLLLADAGIVKEWSKLAGFLSSKKAKNWATACEIIYHIAVITAIAIYATGASDAAAGDSSGNTKWRVGIILLLLLWIVLVGVFTLLASKIRLNAARPLFWSICIAHALVGFRIIYQCIATFNKNQGSFSPVTGSIALRVIFQFLPGALTLMALVTGGVMSLEQVTKAYVPTHGDIPMTSRNNDAAY